MQKKNILISVIDGQGGGIGRQYISALTSVLPKDLPVTIRGDQLPGHLQHAQRRCE